MTATAKAKAVVALALVAAGFAYLGADLWQIARPPDASDWFAAGDAVRSGRKAGDALAFHPTWAQEGAPLFAGMDVFTSETTDWYEVSKHPRTWVVQSPGFGDPERPPEFDEVAARDAGGMTVRLWQSRVAPDLAYDFRARIADAKVARVVKDKREDCTTFKDGHWHCGPVHPWQNVGVETRDIAGAVRPVIWAHALDANNRLEVRYPEVPAGRTLTVHFGLTQRAVESGAGGPLTFQVSVDGREAVNRTLAPAEEGWFRIDVALPPGDSHDVVFTVRTPSHKDRQFCFTADVWK